MVKRVKLEDGSIHNFPDDATEEEISSMLNQTNPVSKPKEQMPSGGWTDPSRLKPELKNLAGGILDTFSRAGTAMGEAGQFMSNTPLTRAINRALPDSVKFVSPEAQRVNIRSLTGADQGGQDILGDPNSDSYKVGNAIGDIGMALGTGGVSKIGMGLGAGATGVLTANPDQELLSSKLPLVGRYMPKGRMASGIEDALFAMMAPEVASLAVKGAPKAASVVKNITAPVASKVGSGIGMAGKAAVDVVMPNRLSKNILNELGGGQSLEEHGKQLASNIKESHAYQKSRISNRYDNFFEENKLGNQDIYPQEIKYTKEGRVKVGDELTRSMPQFPSGLGSPEYQNALEKFKANPSVRNGHELQSQLASEERLLQRQYDTARAKGETVREISENLELTKKSRQKLLDKMHEKMGEEAAAKYKNITADFLNNQVPYYGSTNLREIINGKLTNPSRNNFNAIFQNPEKDINTILDHMGPGSRDAVLFQKLGIQPSDAIATKLVNRSRIAGESGFESYPSERAAKNIKRVKLVESIRDKLLPNRWIKKGLK